ncbi:hypothetical protein OUO_0005 [Helicobacter pylori R046Wa]|nr:hypothetical protein OUO_0005 [Helicobacter pylori R046Wa]
MWNRPLFLKQGAFALTNANIKGSLKGVFIAKYPPYYFKRIVLV